MRPNRSLCIATLLLWLGASGLGCLSNGLALHNADAFVCNYVGMTRAAKDYGEMRMFLLARKSH